MPRTIFPIENLALTLRLTTYSPCETNHKALDSFSIFLCYLQDLIHSKFQLTNFFKCIFWMISSVYMAVSSHLAFIWQYLLILNLHPVKNYLLKGTIEAKSKIANNENKVWNLFKVNNKDKRTTSTGVFLVS